MRVVTAEEMQKIEEKAIKQGLPLSLLMERAGKAVAEEAAKMASNKKVVIIAGKGNNGGDGFVAARLLHREGFKVNLFLLAEPKILKGEAALAFKSLNKFGLKKTILSSKNLPDFKKALQGKSLVIDALFGFGFKGRVKGLTKEVIGLFNQSLAPILSVDIPSGLEASTGKVGGSAVKALRTVTFSCPKIGEVIYPGLEYVGDLKVVDLGISSDLIEKGSSTRLAEPKIVKKFLPLRRENSHKKEVGTVLVIAGSRGMTGAAALTAEAALRTGAGLVTLGVPRSLNPILEQKLTEVITVPLPETKEGTLALEAFPKIKTLARDFTVLALGPGLSQNEATFSLVRKLVKEISLPLVLDADGLNALTKEPELLKKRKAPTVITPHPGELGRFFKKEPQEIQADRLGFAKLSAQKWQLIVVLKGARSLISSPEETIINTTGNSGMASAGTGDVLTGMIAGFLAPGSPPYQAAVLGTYLHGLAGDLAAKDLTEYCLVASDLIKYLPQAIKQLKFTGNIKDKRDEQG